MAPAAQFVGETLVGWRSTSEQAIGDASTSVLFAGTQVALEAGAVFTGTRALGSLAESLLTRSPVTGLSGVAVEVPTVRGLIVNSLDDSAVEMFGRSVSPRTQSIIDRFGDARRVSVMDEVTGNSSTVQIVDGLRANDVRVGDLGKLQAATGNEFNLLRGPGGERVLIQGQVNVTRIPEQYIGDGWKWSGHSHPYSAVASDTDRAFLRALGQESSVIKSAASGQQLRFNQFEDMSNWKPPVFIR